MSDNCYDYDYESGDKTAAALDTADKLEYDDKYILKNLIEGKTRDEIALELNHKNYRTLDMYMRRRGYTWDSVRQTYMVKDNSLLHSSYTTTANGKIQRIIALFSSGLEPLEVAQKSGMPDHRSMAAYMKSKGYIWSTERQNYVLLKGEQNRNNTMEIESDLNEDIASIDNKNIVDHTNIDSQDNMSSPQLGRLESLMPMLEMINKNKDKLAELLSVNTSATIPRYVVGGITITKSLCMSHSLSELVREFSKEKNISQREIFEVAIIEFFKKYGYENEIKALFSS